jgi:hypothetical protein
MNQLGRQHTASHDWFTEALIEKSGERGRNRTFNPLIKSQLLCQLSYAPAVLKFYTAYQTLSNLRESWGIELTQVRRTNPECPLRVYARRTAVSSRAT